MIPTPLEVRGFFSEKGLDGVQSRDGLREQVRTHDVIEYGRTSVERWYPKVVTIQGYDQTAGRPDTRYEVKRISRIHLLEEGGSLPVTLFDPNQLETPGGTK